MFQTFKKLVKLNLDDLLLYLGVEGGLFLLVEVVIGFVMFRTRPADVPIVMNILMPIAGGFVALIAGISHVGVSFDQALRFGQTRKRALGLTLGLASFETAFALALAGLLAVIERFLCVPLWARLAGMNGWVMGNIMPVPEGTMVNGALVSEKTLIIETFILDWYWWLLIFAAAIGGGVIAGALIQRFGSKGGWILWGFCMAPVFLGQLLPWRTHEITNWLFPLLGVIFVAGFLWSIWSLLHAVVRG